MKKRAVIDIGSNSVRLMKEDAKVQKKVVMTQLGKSAVSGVLSSESMRATIDALLEFRAECEDCEIFCFATEAIRSSINGKEFIREIYEKCDIEVELLTPEDEALCGYLGATGGVGNCTVIDVGGASTEIITGQGEEITSSISVPIGASRITALCSEKVDLIYKKLDELFPKEREIAQKVYAIGGTATTLGAIIAKLTRYDSSVIQNFEITYQDIRKVVDELLPLSISERVKRYPVLPPKRAEVIIGGGLILCHVLQLYGIDKVTLSDSDNAEGYLFKRSYEN